MTGINQPTITSSGELFVLNGMTGGELQPMPFFLNKNFRVLAANLDRAYVAVEPVVWSSPEKDAQPPCSVYCFKGGSSEPEYCPEFESIQAPIRQIVFGNEHLVVLTYYGTLYTRGAAVYGSTGHGGARDVPELAPVPAFRDKKVKFVAAGPHFSIAITFEGDVYSWGKAFQGESGLFSQAVETVPRFAPQVTKFKVAQVSCGHGHVLARTETQLCVAWGENTCGQLGLGKKSKPTYKPELVEALPTQVAAVSAGWAHSVAVGLDGRAYSWGLNSHGQLGLGDTTTRHSPHLLHDLVDKHEVLSCHAARAFTILRTEANKALLCGQVPRHPSGEPMDFAPHRPGHHDPHGCVLAPVPLNLSSGGSFASSMSELTDIVAFDRGAVAFARSTVYKVTPNVAPITGGTKVKVFVTGLPFETAPLMQSQSITMSTKLVQDSIPVQVRLRSAAPNCDMIVKGKIVEKDTVMFETPDALPSPLGAVVEQGATLPVSVRVSTDGGFTWTPDRHETPAVKEMDKTLRQHPGEQPQRSGYGLAQGAKDMHKSLKEFKTDFEVRRNANTIAVQGSTMLWLCKWPENSPTHVEPGCAPVTGGTELLVFVPLPTRMPTEHLTVKFVCHPLYSIDDPELEGKAPMRRDAAEITNPCQESVAKLPLVGALEVPVIAFLDPAGRGVCCVSPPMDAESVKFYKYEVQVSLDGMNYLPRSLPFQIYDLRVVGLEPNLGSLVDSTEVKIKTTGYVASDDLKLKVRLDFPKYLDWASRTLHARFDHTSGEICFTMPDLEAEVRTRILEAREEMERLAEEVGGAEGAGEGEGEGDAKEAAPEPDPDGGLAGIEVFVELSLNAQNYTEDRVNFTYHGTIRPDVMQIICGPDGEPVSDAKDDAPKKGGKKGAPAEEASDGGTIKAGSKIGCAARGLPASSMMASASAFVRAELVQGSPDGEVLKTMDLPAILETITIPAASPTGDDPPQEKELLTALAPGIPFSDVQEGVPLYLRSFKISLNGQSFVACPEQLAMKLEPLPPPAPDQS